MKYAHYGCSDVETCMLSAGTNGLIAKRLRVFGKPMRLRILQVLEDGKRPLSDMVDLLSSSQSELSRHLRALCQAGVLSRRREGPNHQYSIADQRVLKLCDLVLRSVANQKPTRPAELHAVSDEQEPGRKSHVRNGNCDSKRTRVAPRK